MKNLDLATLGVEEMSEHELLTIEGGSIFSKGWNKVKEIGSTVGGAIADVAVYIWENGLRVYF